jgi:hypothetical protein
MHERGAFALVLLCPCAPVLAAPERIVRTGNLVLLHIPSSEQAV